jgi:hypothetical protein
MRRLAVAAVLAAVLAPPSGARAAPTAAGRIETDEGTVEILGRPVKVGERIETPEGYLVVEEAGPEDGEVGSFTVVPAEALASRGASGTSAAAGEVASSGDPAEPKAAVRDCRPQRSAYLRELWRESGIEVKDPDAVIDGLQAGSAGPATAYAWFALATDAFRPLAWSSDLRDRAEALARCVRGD